MKRNTATELLRLLTEEEIRRLGKFLRSPYYNYSQLIITLFEQLRKWHPGYEPKRIRPYIFWKKLYPGKEFSEQKYWTLNFNLRCLIERFMAVEELERNETEFKKQLIKSHGRRNAHSLFEKETKLLTEKIKGRPSQDIISYSETMWLKHDYFFNPLTDKYGGAIYAVEDAMEDLDRFYLLAKLRFACEIKNRERMFSKKVPVQLLDESISASEQYEEENPAYLMYKNVLDLYVPEKAEAAFKNGKKLLGDKVSMLSKHDQNEVMLNLRNYATRQVNHGNTHFLKELFSLQKMSLELDLILIDKKIGDAKYGNIVKIGCLVKEFDWTENFINDYAKYLDMDVKEDGKNMNNAVLMFAKGWYNETIALLEQHKFSQILYKLEARLLLTKAWFEYLLINRDVWDLWCSKLESAEKFFRRDFHVSEQKKLAHVNFILAIKQISDLIFQEKKKSHIKRAVNKYFMEEKNIASKKWLMEKLENMIIKK